jgi:ribose-phosphate pyrophosphokinase
VTCRKNRNESTAEITGVSDDDFVDLGGNDCLIVDDICDGGFTFVKLAEALKNKNAGNVYLAVSHAILSKGAHQLLNNGIDHIYCTDGYDTLNGRWKPEIMEKITQYKIGDGLFS